MKYYSIKRMLNSGADYNIIVGGRSNGKSYSVAEMLLDNWQRHKRKFVRIVRYLFDMGNDFCDDYFSRALLSKLEESGLTITYLSPDYRIHSIDEPPKHGEVIGTCCALSCEQKYKSNQYEDVTDIVIEEFCLADEREYLPDETRRFLSLLSTICRGRNVRVWLIGNTISKYNPYFQLLNVNVDKLRLKPGDFVEVPQPNLGFESGSAKVCIEFAKMSYEQMESIPKVLRVMHNDTATTGNYERAEDVIPMEEMGSAIPKNTLFTIRYENALYNVACNSPGYPVYVYRIQNGAKAVKTIVLKWESWEQTFNHTVDNLDVEYRNKWLRGTKIYYSDDQTKHDCRRFLER